MPAWTFESKRWPVKLVVEPLPLDGLNGYHTSIRVGDEELVFDTHGILSLSGTETSDGSQAENVTVLDMGMSHHSASEVRDSLKKYFAPGTYDLLRKNCNSFSDAALAFLLNRRVDGQYRQLERLGVENPRLVELALGYPYTPNPKAADFDQDKVVAEISQSAEEHAPSDRYAHLVYFGLLDRGVSLDYVHKMKQHLEHLGIPDKAFTCDANLFQPSLDLDSASQEGNVVTSGVGAGISLLVPPMGRELRARRKPGSRCRGHDFL